MKHRCIILDTKSHYKISIGDKQMSVLLPGIGLTGILSLISIGLVELISIDFISSSVIAIMLGIVIGNIWNVPEILQPGIRFSAKQLLKVFIVLLGLSMNLTMIMTVGRQAVILLIFTVLTAFMGGRYVSKILGTSTTLTALLSTGIAICGGSAISALSSVIDADEEETAYAISTVYLCDIVLIILFPLVGHWFLFSDQMMGLWSGSAINDTSSVVAASFAFSAEAGKIATMVKLTRTLGIIPITLIFGWMTSRQQSKQTASNIFPWSIVLFIIVALMKTAGWVPTSIDQLLVSFRKILMGMALVAVGLKTDIKLLKGVGVRPLIHASFLMGMVIIVSLMVIRLWLV